MAAGVDVALHCKGDLAEMQAVAAAALAVTAYYLSWRSGCVFDAKSGVGDAELGNFTAAVAEAIRFLETNEAELQRLRGLGAMTTELDFAVADPDSTGQVMEFRVVAAVERSLRGVAPGRRCGWRRSGPFG